MDENREKIRDKGNIADSVQYEFAIISQEDQSRSKINMSLEISFIMSLRKMMNNGLSAMVLILFVFLFIQFLLGMYINLFISIPVMSSLFMMGHGSYGGFPIVMAHMFLGILIGLISLGILFPSIRTGSSRILLSSIGLFLSVLLAGIDGLFFLFDGENNINSYLMSAGFILSLLFAVLLLIYIYQPAPQTAGK